MHLSFWILSLFVASCFGAGIHEVSDKDVMFVKTAHLLYSLADLTIEFSEQMKEKRKTSYYLDDVIQFERQRHSVPFSVNPRVVILEDIKKDQVVAAIDGPRFNALKRVLATILLTTDYENLLAEIAPDTVEARILELVLPHVSTVGEAYAGEDKPSLKFSATKQTAFATIKNFPAIDFLKFMYILKKELDLLPENIQRAFLQSPSQLMNDLNGDAQSSRKIRLLHRRWIGYLRTSQKLKRKNSQKKKNAVILFQDKQQPLLWRVILSNPFIHTSLMLVAFIITLLKAQSTQN